MVQNYLEDMRDTAYREEAFREPVIQKNDLLYIQVYSASADPRLDALYNPAGAQD